MSDSPIVSVIIPTKNSAKTLERCLASIQKQTYQPIELIVVDNFSDDDTPVIARKYTKHFYQKGPERCTQRNFGVSQAKGTYVAVLDSDMYLDKKVIGECVAAMTTTPGVGGVIIPEQSIGEGFWAQCKALERSFYVGIDYMEAARFFRRTDFQDAGGYDEAMVSGEDWDLSQRMERYGTLTRVTSFILHDEQRISLGKTIKKKFYYASKFKEYTRKNSVTRKTGQQTNVFSRYWLFLSQPAKLFRHPLVGVGMLFMKTCEFTFGGLGMLIKR